MKNLISAISTFILVVFIPAIFIGYLIKNDSNDQNDFNTKKSSKAVNTNYETSFKPGLVFTVKG